MQSDLFNLDLHLIRNFRIRSPLVHCITNDVVKNFTANILLALGASPAMIIEKEEAKQFATISDALLINVGTLTVKYAQAMYQAINSAINAGIPWVLDPVAVGVLMFRTQFCQHIFLLKPTVIRANASEILALSGTNKSLSRGVDTTSSSKNALSAAQVLALQTNSIIIVTGEIDYITDGKEVISITGGSPLMTRVVGTGCALSSVVAAICSLPGNRMNNVATACGIMKYAGKVAAEKSNGPGSFSIAFIDALYQLGNEI